MDLKTLNHYLLQLDGIGRIQKLDPEDTLVIEFQKDEGSSGGDGEVLLSFHMVEIIHLPTCMILPAQIRQASGKERRAIVKPNYKWPDRKLYLIKDAVGEDWYVEAESLSFEVLPIISQRLRSDYN